MTTYKPPCIVCGGDGCATSCAAPRFVVTTGGTYIGSVDFDAALRQLEIERDEARRERDKARAEASTLRQALKDYYHECTCNRSVMAAVHLAARLALSATEDKT
jgi:succinate dehydrogenase/fumarate reductase-like Fe-S protein